MLNKRIAEFHSLVWQAVTRVGRNAARLADEVMGIAFPRTVEEAMREGAFAMLREGVLVDIRRLLRSAGDLAQRDFATIEPSFRPFVAKLKSGAYWVETLEEYVPVPELIENPELLDDARQFMRRKGIETLEEADKLDELYDAVIRAGRGPR
jgi:hypothetical protein